MGPRVVAGIPGEVVEDAHLTEGTSKDAAGMGAMQGKQGDGLARGVRGPWRWVGVGWMWQAGSY